MRIFGRERTVLSRERRTQARQYIAENWDVMLLGAGVGAASRLLITAGFAVTGLSVTAVGWWAIAPAALTAGAVCSVRKVATTYYSHRRNRKRLPNGWLEKAVRDGFITGLLFGSAGAAAAHLAIEHIAPLMARPQIEVPKPIQTPKTVHYLWHQRVNSSLIRDHHPAAGYVDRVRVLNPPSKPITVTNFPAAYQEDAFPPQAAHHDNLHPKVETPQPMAQEPLEHESIKTPELLPVSPADNVKNTLKDVLKDKLLSHSKTMDAMARKALATHNPAFLAHATKEISFYLDWGRCHDQVTRAAGMKLIKVGAAAGKALGLHDINSRMLDRDWNVIQRLKLFGPLPT